jgi:hypothetical protein
MKQLEELALSEIRSIDPWSDAKMGTLMQMLVHGQPTIGVRGNYKFGNGTVDGIAIIAGDSMGGFVLGTDLSGPALDVSETLEIVATKLGPHPRPRQLPPGLLVQYEGKHYLWINVLPSGGAAGFICLENGEHFTSLPPDGQIAVAASVGVRMRLKRPA